uniref:Uncharacterized protein n=1 Tax=Lepeophtheirus salmonis TaxID=72036 RepID=A0A0K2UUA7_LEPSM
MNYSFKSLQIHRTLQMMSPATTGFLKLDARK